MVAFRKPKKYIIVRAIIKTQCTEPNICGGCNGRSGCQVCSIMTNSDKFTNEDKARTFNLRKRYF